MATPPSSLEGVSIVLRGHFNPAIITPGWLLAQKLIGVEDFGETRPKLITPEVSNFEGPWFIGHITQDALQFSTLEVAESEPLRDLVVGILLALSHTPVAALGINHDYHFQAGSREAWDAVGDSLTPKAPWGDSLLFPGMLSVGLLAARQDEEAGHVQVTTEPSRRVTPFGVYLGYNDHYALLPPVPVVARREDMVDPYAQGESVEPSAERGRMALDLLESKWRSSAESAQAVLRALKALAGGVA